MSLDLHGSLKTTQALAPATRTANAAVLGDIIDLADFPAVLFVFQSGTITDGSTACEVMHGDQADGSDMAAADASALVGTAPTFGATDDNAVKKVGYRRHKRYARVRATQTGAVSGGLLGAVAILGESRVGPVS